jgi:hypothetical protein
MSRFRRILARKSRAAIAAAPSDAVIAAATTPFPEAPPSSARHAPIERCIGCHDRGGASVGPLPPFGRPDEPADRLRTRPAAHGTLLDEIRFRLSPAAGSGRMPLGANPGQTERAAPQAFFEALARSSR